VPRPGGAAPGPGAARQAVAFATAQIGKPYLWGAASPGAYDCSGLVLAAYRSVGIYLPRVSRAQWSAGPHVGLGDLAPGDLVFFAHNTGAPSTTSACTSAAAPWSRRRTPGRGCAPRRSAAVITSARSARPAETFERSDRDLPVKLRGSRSPGVQRPAPCV
jgi:NlpC/P60 family